MNLKGELPAKSTFTGLESRAINKMNPASRRPVCRRPGWADSGEGAELGRRAAHVASSFPVGIAVEPGCNDEGAREGHPSLWASRSCPGATAGAAGTSSRSARRDIGDELEKLSIVPGELMSTAEAGESVPTGTSRRRWSPACSTEGGVQRHRELQKQSVEPTEKPRYVWEGGGAENKLVDIEDYEIKKIMVCEGGKRERLARGQGKPPAGRPCGEASRRQSCDEQGTLLDFHFNETQYSVSRIYVFPHICLYTRSYLLPASVPAEVRARPAWARLCGQPRKSTGRWR